MLMGITFDRYIHEKKANDKYTERVGIVQLAGCYITIDMRGNIIESIILKTSKCIPLTIKPHNSNPRKY